MRYVLFVCNHNAGRSQMAQAFFERHAPADIRAESAGSSPARQLWPVVVEAMAEVGLDLSEPQAAQAAARDAAACRLGGDDGLRGRVPVRADDRRGVGHRGSGRACRSSRSGRFATRSRPRCASWSRPSSTRSAPIRPRTGFRLQHLLPALAEEFEATHSPEEIRACADAVLSRFDDARVRTLRPDPRPAPDPGVPAPGDLRRAGERVNRTSLIGRSDACARRLEALSDRLTAEYDGMFSRETVTALVVDSVERLGPFTVTDASCRC